MGYIFLFIALVMNSIANFILKKGAMESAKISSGGANQGLWRVIVRFLDTRTIIAIVLFGLNIIFYKQALMRLPITVAYPIMSALGLIIILLLGFIFLGEKCSVIQIVGFAAITIGLVLATMGQGIGG